MATQRYISTSFWDDKWIQELDPSEKLLYLYLMTNPLTNIAGVYKITIRRIVFDTGFNEDTVKRILDRFKKDKKAFLYGEYMIIPTWPKHQKCEQRSKIKNGIISELQEVPKHILEFAADHDYQFNLSLVDTTIIAKKERVGVSGSKRKKIIELADNKCEQCGGTESLEIHHVTPIADGGNNDIDNLIVLCKDCHVKNHSPHRVYGLETHPEKVHNYSDIDLDLDTDIDNSASPAPADDSTADDKKTDDDTADDKQLFHAIENAFLSQLNDETQYNYPRERTHIKKLIGRVRNKASPAEFLQGIIETFYRLHTGRDKFWTKQPFLPSVLNSSGIWPRVLEETKSDYADTGVELWK